jgi:hypothetical protein
MKIKVVEFADFGFTTKNLSCPKGKNVVLPRNTSASTAILREL